MRHSAAHRALTTVLALWFALVSVDPVGLHGCPMHGGHGATRGAGVAVTHAHGHDHGADASSGHPRPSPDGHRCLCLGDCQSGGGALAATAVGTLHGHVTVAPVSPQPFWRAHRVMRVAHLLPFAHAPPAALA